MMMGKGKKSVMSVFDDGRLLGRLGDVGVVRKGSSQPQTKVVGHNKT